MTVLFVPEAEAGNLRPADGTMPKVKIVLKVINLENLHCVQAT
jgi:hypothetical protein